MSRVATTWTIGVLVLLWVPIVLLAAFSFNEARFATTFTAFTLDWYARLFEDRELRGILVNTLVVAGGSALLSTVLGTMAAMGLRGTFAGKRVAAGLVTLPVMIPDIVLAISLLVLFGPGGFRSLSGRRWSRTRRSTWPMSRSLSPPARSLSIRRSKPRRWISDARRRKRGSR